MSHTVCEYSCLIFNSNFINSFAYRILSSIVTSIIEKKIKFIVSLSVIQLLNYMILSLCTVLFFCMQKTILTKSEIFIIEATRKRKEVVLQNSTNCSMSTCKTSCINIHTHTHIIITHICMWFSENK